MARRRARAGPAGEDHRDAKRLRTGPAVEASTAAVHRFAAANAEPHAIASAEVVDVQRVETAPSRRWRRAGNGRSDGGGSDGRRRSDDAAPQRGAAGNSASIAPDPPASSRPRRRKQRAADRRAAARERERSALRAAIPRCARTRALAPAMMWIALAVGLIGCGLDVWRDGGVSVALVGRFEALLQSRGARAAQVAAVGAANALLWRAVAVRRSAQRAASAP